MKQSFIQELQTLCGSIEGRVGLYFEIPETDEVFSLNAREKFASASTIKIAILAALLEMAEAGQTDLDRKLPVAPENWVGGAGILQSLSRELRLSIFDYAELMMVLSDNVATNQIIDVVGLDRVNDLCRRLDLRCTCLRRKMMTPGPQNETCAEDLGLLLKAMLEGRLVNPRASMLMMRIMAGQRTGKFRDVLPCVQCPDPREPLRRPQAGEVLLISKGGTLKDPNIMHDAGIFVMPSGTKAILVLTCEAKDPAQALPHIQHAATALYQYLQE